MCVSVLHLKLFVVQSFLSFQECANNGVFCYPSYSDMCKGPPVRNLAIVSDLQRVSLRNMCLINNVLIGYLKMGFPAKSSQ
jgi:hypothetical protein